MRLLSKAAQSVNCQALYHSLWERYDKSLARWIPYIAKIINAPRENHLSFQRQLLTFRVSTANFHRARV